MTEPKVNEVVDPKQIFQSRTKTSNGDNIMNLMFCLRLNFLSRFDSNKETLTVEGSTCFLFHCKHYHM